MRLWVLPSQVWLPLALGAVAPLLLGAVYILFTRRRQHRIATALTLRSVLLLGFGFATLAAVATVSVVRAGFREIRDRHASSIRALGTEIGRVPLGPTSGAAQLSLELFRAKDANVSFVVVGAGKCGESCLVSTADVPSGILALKDRLSATWPTLNDNQRTMTLDERAYLLVSAAVLDTEGNPFPDSLAVVAGVDATYVVDQAGRTAWTLLAISYVLLAVVGWMTWHQVSRSLATRMNAITTHLRGATVEEPIEMLPA
ncbi:MAG TPA: hypothetical protein VHV78_07985, partial [Gemmatimonadaceae bacterium]|nr:hypothetical protein [Gemmatimonadaceae bacterium]